MRNGNFSLNVLVAERLVPEIAELGHGWVVAERGRAFSLLLTNDGDSPVLAVPSVDGLSVMDGEPASYRSGGYIIGAHSQVTVPGWRLNDAAVARFEFGTAAEGYARQMDRSTQNVGVIAAAFFDEKWVPFAVAERDRSTDDVSVKFGAKAEHHVRETTFDRESQPKAVIELRYDTQRGIQDRGIGCPVPPRWSVPSTGLTAPFPMEKKAAATTNEQRFWITMAVVIGTVIVLVTALSR